MVNVILDELTWEQRVCVGLALCRFRDASHVFVANLTVDMVMPCVLQIALCDGVEPPFIRQVCEYLGIGNRLTGPDGRIRWLGRPLEGLPR